MQQDNKYSNFLKIRLKTLKGRFNVTLWGGCFVSRVPLVGIAARLGEEREQQTHPRITYGSITHRAPP